MYITKARYTPKPSWTGQSNVMLSRAKSACVRIEADSLSVGTSLLVRSASSKFKLNQSLCQLKLFSAIIMSSTLMMIVWEKEGDTGLTISIKIMRLVDSS